MGQRPHRGLHRSGAAIFMRCLITEFGSQELRGKGHARKCGDPGRTGEGMTLCLSFPEPLRQGLLKAGWDHPTPPTPTGNSHPGLGAGVGYINTGLDHCPRSGGYLGGQGGKAPECLGTASSLVSHCNKSWTGLGTGGSWPVSGPESLHRDLCRKAGFGWEPRREQDSKRWEEWRHGDRKQSKRAACLQSQLGKVDPT